MAHSTYSPSATKREYLCPPSHNACKPYPRKNNPDAAHGTAAHYVHELCLKNDHDADFYAACHIAVNEKGRTEFLHEKRHLKRGELEFEVDDEMITAVQSSVDWCRELPGRHYVEVRVDHTRWCPKVYDADGNRERQYGTADHIAIDYKRGVIYVTDLKYGQGVQVFADHNMQATKYALGAWAEFKDLCDIKTVVIRIAQPRLKHFDVWEVSIEELLEFGEKIRKQLELTLDDDAEFNPTEEGCKFCAHAGDCVALMNHTNKVRALAFDDETTAKPKTRKAKAAAAKIPKTTLAEKIEAWRAYPLVQIRMKAIEEAIFDALEDGPRKGLKLVEAITHRRWKVSEEAVEDALKALGIPRHKYMKTKLASPNQIEEVLPRDEHSKLTELWEKPRGEPCIVDENDKRQEYTEKRRSEHIDAFD